MTVFDHGDLSDGDSVRIDGDWFNWAYVKMLFRKGRRQVADDDRAAVGEDDDGPVEVDLDPDRLYELRDMRSSPKNPVIYQMTGESIIDAIETRSRSSLQWRSVESTEDHPIFYAVPQRDPQDQIDYMERWADANFSRHHQRLLEIEKRIGLVK